MGDCQGPNGWGRKNQRGGPQALSALREWENRVESHVMGHLALFYLIRLGWVDTTLQRPEPQAMAKLGSCQLDRKY